MLDTLIRDVNVLDGTGSPPFRAHVGLTGERIALLSESLPHHGGARVELVTDLANERRAEDDIARRGPRILDHGRDDLDLRGRLDEARREPEIERRTRRRHRRLADGIEDQPHEWYGCRHTNAATNCTSREKLPAVLIGHAGNDISPWCALRAPGPLCT